MDGKSQTRRNGKHGCPNCIKVFSSLKAVYGHQRMHKTTVSTDSPLPPPPPPPPKNPYDGHEAFVYPGEESEKEEGEITSEDGSQCARKNGSSSEAIEIKMEDITPDFFEAAATLLMLQYESVPCVGVCPSSTASDSNDPQENSKTEVKVKVDPQTSVAAPKKEKGTGSSSGDGDGGRVFECNRCHKRFGTQQALGGHMAGHKNTDRKAAAMAEGGAPSASQIVKEHKCELCSATFDSGQALGGHMRKHRVLVHWKADDGTAAVVVKKEVAENVITEDIHERNDDHKRIRLTLDLNQEPIDIEDD